jgi:hypothetical protein
MQVQIPDQKVLDVAEPYNGPQPVHSVSLLVQKYLKFYCYTLLGGAFNKFQSSQSNPSIKIKQNSDAS